MKAVIEKWDDGTISIYCPELKKFVLNGSGKTVEEAKHELYEALEEYRSMFKERKQTIPEELQDGTFEYEYDLSSFFETFKFINVSKFAEYAGINPSLLRQYKNKIAFASESQKEKIEAAIHKAGHQLTAVRL